MWRLEQGVGGRDRGAVGAGRWRRWSGLCQLHEAWPQQPGPNPFLATGCLWVKTRCPTSCSMHTAFERGATGSRRTGEGGRVQLPFGDQIQSNAHWAAWRACRGSRIDAADGVVTASLPASPLVPRVQRCTAALGPFESVSGASLRCCPRSLCGVAQRNWRDQGSGCDGVPRGPAQTCAGGAVCASG